MAKNNVARAAIHAAAQTSLHPAQVNENTRDGWDKEKYENKNLDTSHHYDVTRKNINFMVDAEGIKPLSVTNTEKMYNRYIERLRELDFKAYDPDATNQPNSYIDWVFSGDHDVMHKMAFGDQDVALDLSRDNSHIVRKPEIEEFAKAVYGFACQKFGADNVVGAEVHLDETTPHIHINVIPTAMRMQRGRATSLYVHKDDPNNTITSKEYKNLSKTARKNWIKGPTLERTQKLCVSFSGMVGENRTERGRYLKQFHTDFFEQVGARFGLARGREKETLSEEELKNRRHKTSAELEAERQQQIKEAMELDAAIQGKKKEKKDLTDDNAKLEKKNESLKAETNDAQNKLNSVIGDVQEVEAKLADEQQKLEEARKKVSDADGKRYIAEHNLRKATMSLDEKNAQIAEADAKLEAVNDKVKSEEQRADAKIKDTNSKIAQAEQQLTLKQAAVSAEQHRYDTEKAAADEKLQKLDKFVSAAEVKQEDITYKKLNISLEEKKLIDDIIGELSIPIKTFQSAKSWSDERLKNIKLLVQNFNTSVENKVTNENASLKTSIDTMYTYYLQQIAKAKKGSDKFSSEQETKVKADVMRAILKGLQHPEFGMYIEKGEDFLSNSLREMYDSKVRAVADYAYFATNRHKSPEEIISLSNDWRIWKSNNLDLFDEEGNFAKALKEASWELSDKVWDDKGDLLSAFNKLMAIGDKNSKDPFMRGRRNAENVAKGVILLTELDLNNSQCDKAKSVMSLVVDQCDIVLAEKQREMEKQKAIEQEKARKEYERSLYESKTFKNAVNAIVRKSSDSTAHWLSFDQAESIINALGLFGEDSRKNAADKMKSMAEEQAHCNYAWLEDTFEEVDNIVENFTELVLLVAVPPQPVVSVGCGGGGGSNDLPKKRDDDWWERFGKLLRPSASSIPKNRGYKPKR